MYQLLHLDVSVVYIYNIYYQLVAHLYLFSFLLRNVSAIIPGHLQGASKFIDCAAYVVIYAEVVCFIHHCARIIKIKMLKA